MQVVQGSLSGLLEILPKKHQDDRGYFSETFKLEWFRDYVADVQFVQENESLSRRAGTVRGLHFQSEPHAQGKLLRCLAGRIFDVAVDIRQGSPTFGEWASVELSAEAGNQFWVPPGFAHGFCTLTPDCVLSYKVTSVYSPANDLGMSWNDPVVRISWPEIADPTTLSEKDRRQPNLDQLPEYFRL